VPDCEELVGVIHLRWCERWFSDYESIVQIPKNL